LGACCFIIEICLEEVSSSRGDSRIEFEANTPLHTLEDGKSADDA